MRVIGGYLKGQKILAPTDKSTRPLKDRVRESIFNIIEHSNNETINLKGAKILDLFAGTGSFGIECLSRGAEKVVFFENYHQSNMLLKKNLEKLKLLKKASVYQSDSYKFNEEIIFDNKFDIIFLDPPFKDKNIETIIYKIKKKKLANKRTLLILHRNKKTIDKFSENFLIQREKNYGISKIIFGKLS